MSLPAIVLVVEMIIVLMGVAGFLFFLRWKRKKTKSAELEKLLDNVVNHEQQRKTQLMLFVKEKYGLEAEAAEESILPMIEAEKQFVQQFLKQQMEQTPVTDFYQNLCVLLDQYLSLVPANKMTSLIANVDDTETQEKLDEEDLSNSEDIEAEESNENNKLDEEKLESSNVTEKEDEELDWGDAFEESGDKVDDATKINSESEEKLKS